MLPLPPPPLQWQSDGVVFVTCACYMSSVKQFRGWRAALPMKRHPQQTCHPIGKCSRLLFCHWVTTCFRCRSSRNEDFAWASARADLQTLMQTLSRFDGIWLGLISWLFARTTKLHLMTWLDDNSFHQRSALSAILLTAKAFIHQDCAVFQITVSKAPTVWTSGQH